MIIDPHRAAFEPSGDGDGAIAIGTPDRTAQAVDGVVYLRESIVDVIEADDGENRGELLFIHKLRAVLYIPIIRFDRSEEHTSELQSLMRISYAVFCLKKKKQ